MCVEFNLSHIQIILFYKQGLAQLATSELELMEEEQSPSKKHLQKSKHIAKRQEMREQLDAHVAEADSDADDF
jgi:hypothetical protein